MSEQNINAVWCFEPNLETFFANALQTDSDVSRVYTSVSRQTLPEDYVALEVIVNEAKDQRKIIRVNGLEEYCHYSFSLKAKIRTENAEGSDAAHARKTATIRRLLTTSSLRPRLEDPDIFPLYSIGLLEPAGTSREANSDYDYLESELEYEGDFYIPPESFDPDERLLEVLARIHMAINGISLEELY